MKIRKKLYGNKVIERWKPYGLNKLDLVQAVLFGGLAAYDTHNFKPIDINHEKSLMEQDACGEFIFTINDWIDDDKDGVFFHLDELEAFEHNEPELFINLQQVPEKTKNDQGEVSLPREEPPAERGGKGGNVNFKWAIAQQIAKGIKKDFPHLTRKEAAEQINRHLEAEHQQEPYNHKYLISKLEGLGFSKGRPGRKPGK